MKLPKKERIFICHNEDDISNFDVRENMPVWREVKSLLEQFKSHTSKLNLSKEEKEKLDLLTFYLKKVVEHYDPKVPEFNFLILCSIIETIGNYYNPSLPHMQKFLKAIEVYFDPRFTEDLNFMKKMKEVYTNIGRSKFTHSTQKLHWSSQIGSQANLPLMKDSKGEFSVIGNKHLFQIAVEVITKYFESKKINQ